MHFEFDDWDYYFDIIEISDKEAIIKFEDKAKHASYHAIGMIKFKWHIYYKNDSISKNNKVS